MNQMTHDGGRKTIVQYGVNHTEDDINDSLPDSDEDSQDEMDFSAQVELRQSKWRPPSEASEELP